MFLYLEAATRGLRTATLLKKRLWPRCFPVNFLKFLRTTFFKEHVWMTASVCFIYFEFFKQFRSIFFRTLFEILNIWVEYQTYTFCTLILLPYVKSRVYSMILIIPTLLPITLSLRQNCLILVLWKFSTWSQRNRS